MAFSGSYEPEHPGETFQSGMAFGLPSPAASIVGVKLVCGHDFGRLFKKKRSNTSNWTGNSIPLMLLLSEPTNMPPGQKKTSPDGEALGRSRGGFSTKVHLRTDQNGRLMHLVLTPGQRHEATQVEALLNGGAVRRAGPGRPKKRPKRLVGDKGYCGKPVRQLLRRRGIRFTIAKRKNMSQQGPFDKSIYRLRNQIERTFNRFKQFRRLATRYEKRAVNYQAMWLIAAILLAL